MAKRTVGGRAQRTDMYPNRALFSVTQSAANTLTFTQIRFGTGVFTGTALIISRVEWFLDETSVNGLAQGSDEVFLALTNRDDLTSLAASSMNVLLLLKYNIAESGTPANANILEIPMVSDYSTLPGGGLIYPANPLFVGLHSSGLGAAATLDCIMYYTTRQLADADYVELVQSLIPVNI